MITVNIPAVPVYDAIVDAGGDGNYTEINAACAALGTYAVIGVKAGTYTETADIEPKDGQQIIGLGSQGGNAGGAITVQMGANQVIIDGKIDVCIRDLHFEYTWTGAAAYVFDAQNSCAYCIFENLSFDCTSSNTVPHYGLRDQWGYQNQWRNIYFYGNNQYSRNILYTDSSWGCVYNNFQAEGWNHENMNAVDTPDTGWCFFKEFLLTPSFGAGDYYLIGDTNSGGYSNVYESLLLWGGGEGGFPQDTCSSGIAAFGWESSFSNIFIQGCETAIYNEGSYTAINNAIIEGQNISGWTSVGIVLDDGLGITLSNIQIVNTDGAGIQGVDAVDVAIVNAYIEEAGTYAIDMSNPTSPDDWSITNLRTDSAVSIASTGATLVNCTIDGALTIGATADDILLQACTFGGTAGFSGPVQADNCIFEGVATISVTGCRFTTCRFDVGSTFNGAQGRYSNCRFTGNQTIGSSADESVFVNCYFANDLTINAGGNNLEFDQTYINGTLSDSGSDNYFALVCVGELEDADNTTADTIDVVDEWHAMYRPLVTTAIRNMAANVGARRSITAAATAGGGSSTKFTTSVAHGLSVGDPVTITGTTNYDGVYLVSVVDDATNFTVVVAYVATDTGTVIRAAAVQANNKLGMGRYQVNVSISASAAVANKDFEFAVFQNASVVDKIKTRRRFASTDTGSMSLSGILEVSADDWIWVGMQNITDATNITIRDVNISMHKID